MKYEVHQKIDRKGTCILVKASHERQIPVIIVNSQNDLVVMHTNDVEEISIHIDSVDVWTVSKQKVSVIV